MDIQPSRQYMSMRFEGFDVGLDFKLQKKYYAKPRHSSCSDSLSACIKERFHAWRVRQVRFVHVVTVHNLGDRRSPWMALLLIDIVFT